MQEKDEGGEMIGEETWVIYYIYIYIYITTSTFYIQRYGSNINVRPLRTYCVWSLITPLVHWTRRADHESSKGICIVGNSNLVPHFHPQC